MSNGMKILLVDDDAFLRDMYATKFAEEGYQVVVAKSGPEALTVLKDEGDVKVVMLDMIMPGMSGIELLKEIGELELKVAPKCIVLSNQSENDDVDEAMRSGAAGYIIKAEMIPSDVVGEVKKLIQ